MLLIIGSGNISKNLTNKISQSKIDYDFISYRDFSKHYRSIIYYSSYKKIIFLGYDQYNFLFNVIKFYNFIKILKKQNSNSHILFFNTQYTFIHQIDKNFTLLNKLTDINTYTIYKNLCSYILKKSNLNYTEIYLPIVYNLENIQNYFLKHLSISDNIVLPNEGKNFNFFLDINHLIIFLIKWIDNKVVFEKMGKYFLYSKHDTILNFLYFAYNSKIKNIHKSEFQNPYNLKKNILWYFLLKKIVKNFFKIFFINLKFKNNLKNSKINYNFTYYKNHKTHLNPDYNFLLNFDLDIKKIDKKFKIFLI